MKRETTRFVMSVWTLLGVLVCSLSTVRGADPIKLNGPLVVGGEVSLDGLQFSPDGSRVLYLADQDTDGVTEAYVRIVHDRANTGGGDWDTAATWDQDVAPDEVMQVFIDTPATVTASGNSGNTTKRTVNELSIGGGPGTSTLDLEAGAVISALHGMSILSGGVVRGDSRIEASVAMAAGGELRVADGQRLVIGGTSFANPGRVAAIGRRTT